MQQRRPGGDFIESRLERALAGAGLSPADRHLCQELAYGVVRWQATLDWLIAGKTQPRPQKPFLQTLLRLGLYQLFWLERIPNHAAVHATVELAKRLGSASQAGFVNAVLRQCLRESDAIRAALARLRLSQPHLGYSHPEWLVRRWQARWGPARAARLLEWNNTPPKTFARLNALKTKPELLLARWRQENVEFDPVRRDWLDESQVFELNSHPPLARLPSFRDGWFYVQDPSTLLAPHELAPQPGDSVLDLCAAPGGKLGCLAQLMRNQGQLVAYDPAPERRRLLQQNCARLGLTCMSLLPSPPPPLFSRVLVDVPCSNTGVMRRRVELRWRLRPDEIERLCATQLELLREGAAGLRPGGTLVYSTCSLEPEENDGVVDQFLGGNADFSLAGRRELLPFVDEVDGAYVARLTKRA